MPIDSVKGLGKKILSWASFPYIAAVFSFLGLTYAVLTGSVLLIVLSLAVGLGSVYALLSKPRQLQKLHGTPHSPSLPSGFITGLFVIAVLLTLVSFLSSDSYRLASLVTILAAYSLIGLHITIYPRITSSLVLLEIAIVSILARIRIFFAYPSLLGNDMWFHASFVQQLVALGKVPAIPGYESFPVFHILVTVLYEVLGIAVKEAIFVVGASQVGVILILFMICRRFFGERIGLVAATLGSFISEIFAWSIAVIPMTLGLLFFILIIYLLVIRSESLRHAGVAGVLIAFLLLVMAVTHPLSAAILLVFLVLLWFAGVAMRSYVEGRRFVTFTLVVITSTIFVGYWMYASGFFGQVVLALSYGFTLDYYLISPGVGSNLYASFWDALANGVLAFLAIIGTFIILTRARRRPSVKPQEILLATLVLASFIVFSHLARLNALLPGRWLAFASILLTIPSSLGFARLITNQNGTLSGVRFVVVLSIVALIMLTNVRTNIDQATPFAKTPRSALTEAELKALEFFSRSSVQALVTDTYYANAIQHLDSGSVRVRDGSAFLSGDTQSFNGILLLRSEVRWGVVFAEPPPGGGYWIQVQYESEYIHLLIWNSTMGLLYDNGKVIGLSSSS